MRCSLQRVEVPHLVSDDIQCHQRRHPLAAVIHFLGVTGAVPICNMAARPISVVQAAPEVGARENGRAARVDAQAVVALELGMRLGSCVIGLCVSRPQ